MESQTSESPGTLSLRTPLAEPICEEGHEVPLLLEFVIADSYTRSPEFIKVTRVISHTIAFSRCPLLRNKTDPRAPNREFTAQSHAESAISGRSHAAVSWPSFHALGHLVRDEQLGAT